MKIKTLFNLLAISFLVLALGAAHQAQAQGPGAQDDIVPLGVSLGTGFTYQGRLTDNSGNPIAGPCALRFTLYQSAAGNDPVGAPLTANGVTTDNGYFSVNLDFGAAAFTGDGRFLKIEVDCGSGYTTLDPRVELTPAPYALYAAKAPWSGLTNIPPDFADGVDDNTTYTAGSGLNLAGTQFSVTGAPWSGLTGVPAGFADNVDNGSAYQNVKVVAQSGGDFTSIQAALDSITDASASNPYLVYVAPGVYTEQVTMKQYVDIEGAGELITKITYTGSASLTTGTVVGASNSELRFLTVSNTGGAVIAVAIYNNLTSPRLTHVTASANGASGQNIGVLNESSASPVMTHVTATASGGSGTDNYAVENNNASPTMTDVTASAIGGDVSVGVYNIFDSSPILIHVDAYASSATNNYGLYNYRSAATVRDSVIHTDAGTNRYGIFMSGTTGVYVVTVDHSQILVANATDTTIRSDASFVTYVGASQLSGGPVDTSAGGSVTCIGVYDEQYANPGYTTCP